MARPRRSPSVPWILAGWLAGGYALFALGLALPDPVGERLGTSVAGYLGPAVVNTFLGEPGARAWLAPAPNLLLFALVHAYFARSLAPRAALGITAVLFAASCALTWATVDLG